jgi:hypothetical protein
MGMLHLRLIYQGGPPVHWTGGPREFGLQDKDNVLLAGQPVADGGVAFDFTVEVKGGSNAVPVLLGRFTHGAPAQRFLYLAWRNANGAYALRFKVPLTSITKDHVDDALQSGRALVGLLVVAEQRATTTGANIGGTRQVDWQ